MIENTLSALGNSMKVGYMTEREHAERQKKAMKKRPKLGSGERFEALSEKLSEQEGVNDPDALAAAIGRKKFGAQKMAAMAAHGRKG